MGEILGLGLSHYPGSLVSAALWPSFLERNTKVGRLDPALFADKNRWPAEMRAEWGNDEGQASAREHRRRLIDGYHALRAELDAFNPDLVLIWGDDQYENFQSDCVPPFNIGIFDQVVSKPYRGGRFEEPNVWDISADTELKIACHADGALGLCRALLDAGFDISYSLKTRHPRGLSHAFNNTVVYLDYEREGFPYPIVPFHVNCYGNELMKTAAQPSGDATGRMTPPSPTPKRCFDVGAATARYFAQSPWRIALIGSSSWSHASLTRKHERLYPDMEADRARLADLHAGTFANWRDIPQSAIEDSGQHEMLNWICLAGAMSALDRRPALIDYVESYIFNSSKCFASFPPAGFTSVASSMLEKREALN